jgi:hypothetical protein
MLVPYLSNLQQSSYTASGSASLATDQNLLKRPSLYWYERGSKKPSQLKQSDQVSQPIAKQAKQKPVATLPPLSNALIQGFIANEAIRQIQSKAPLPQSQVINAIIPQDTQADLAQIQANQIFQRQQQENDNALALLLLTM